jgi:hypothetical protein
VIGIRPGDRTVRTTRPPADATTRLTTGPAEPARRGASVSFPRRRWITPTLVTLLVLTLLIGIGGYRLYVAPTVDQLAPGRTVDAVVALGGVVESATYAQQLVQQGAAPVLVLSDPYPDGAAAAVDQACEQPAVDYRVICFRPDPSTTRGEAQQIAALAAQHGWTSVAVVAPTFHLSRARQLVQRCYAGTLLMLDPPRSFPWANWTYQYVRQSLGFAKMLIWRGC